MQQRLRSTAAAIMLLAPLGFGLVAPPAQAAKAVVAQPGVRTMSIDSDAGLSPGATLRVQVFATPGARRASLTLGNSGITVPLKQKAKGTYAGSYVVRRKDHIDPTGLMTARVTFGDRTYSRQFNYPPSFQALAMGSAPAPRIAIERFVMRPMGRLEAGRELRFRVRGAAGADAWVDIPGVISGIDLAEVRPGVYEGTYTVRRRDDLDAFAKATATLREGKQRVTARVDLRERDEDRRAGRDERPPTISDLAPANGEQVDERGRTHIAAKVADEGSGIDRDSVRLRVNGHDVTSDARVSDNEVDYRANLDPGRYTAELSVRDEAGNATTKGWTFDVTPRGERLGSTSLPLTVTSHRDNAVVDANGRLGIEGRTAPFANVRVQVTEVANIGGVLGVSQPVADLSVQADRNGHFEVGVAPRGLPLPGTRYDVHLTASNGSMNAEERLTLIQRQG